mgnify:CR=1 FL=1
MTEPILNIKNATDSIKGDSDNYIEHNFIDVVYDLVKAKIRSTQAPDKNLVKNLVPINGVYSGYFLNRVEFTDPRDKNKIYTDEWERTVYDNEEDRLRVIRSMNEKIKDYNDWLTEQKEAKGIEAMLHYREESYFKEWLLNIYLVHPTLTKLEQNEPVPHRTINNQFFYQIATNMNSDDYIIRFNKTIYDWILSLLPQSFNDPKQKFLSNDHILYYPKLEFENWFMRNGLAINECKNMFDKYVRPKGLTDEEINNNQLRLLTKQTKTDQRIKREQRKVIYNLKNPAEKRLRDMIQNDTLSSWVDTHCRKKNGSINKSALGRELGMDRETAVKLLIELDQAYLLRPLHPKETGGKYKMVKVDKTKQLKG